MHVFQFYGLSGSGKTTLSYNLYNKLNKQYNCEQQDGDNVRNKLNNHDFTLKGRFDNIDRLARLAKNKIEKGVIVIIATITPLSNMRRHIRNILSKNATLIFIDTPLQECIFRDVKGLYKKAISGKIENFTGISSPFDYPKEKWEQDVRIKTLDITINDASNLLYRYAIKCLN